MKTVFELMGSTFIEVDPYRRSKRHPNQGIRGGANILSIDFSTGRDSSGVDLRWHHPKELKGLSNEHKNELCDWQKTAKGKKALNESRATASKKRKHGDRGGGGDSKSLGQGSWKKNMKQAVKTQNDFKTIMSVLAAEETRNKANILAINPPNTSPNTTTGAISSAVTKVAERFSATTIKLNSIIKRK